MHQIISDLAFPNAGDSQISVKELIIELFRVLLRKTDRTVIDLSDKKQGTARLSSKLIVKNSGETAKMIDFEDLDAEILQTHLVRLLQWTIELTSQPYPYMLLNPAIHTALHTAVAHLLTLSELKAQKMSDSLPLVLDLAKKLILTSKIHSATTSAQELVNALTQKRQKMLQFFAGGCREDQSLITKINKGKRSIFLICNIVLLEVDQVIAPRKTEKYVL